MAEASISVDQDQFICPVCLDLLKDPVTVPCGHSFCKECINVCWDQEDQRQVYCCPQCRGTFTPRPVLHRNTMLAEVVEKLKMAKTGQAASAAHCYAEAADVECDFCPGTKHKAIKSCLTCLASYCETHIRSHDESPVFKKHEMVEASSKLQEKICSKHKEFIKIYCCTDQSCICYSCSMDEHRGHDTITTVAERTEKQSELKEVQKKFNQRLQEKRKMVENMKQAVNAIRRSAQTAVEDSEKIFTELICSIEKKRSEVRKLIRDQEKAEVSRAERVLEQLEQEIADLKRKDAELEQLSHTEDHIHFLQSFQSLCGSSGSEKPSCTAVRQRLLFAGVKNYISDLKERIEVFCREELDKNPPHVSTGVGDVMILHSEPTTREDFLKYFCNLTLDPNSAHGNLSLFEDNRVVICTETVHNYPDHPERFDCRAQVLSKESVSGRCYWEVEWRSGEYSVFIAVTYKAINRKGRSIDCGFGFNNQSWSLHCSSTLTFCHNSVQTQIPAPPPSRIGVYVDHSAGTLSFYGVSDTMTLLHRLHTTFTQPLYAGFWVYGSGSSVRLCDQK